MEENSNEQGNQSSHELFLIKEYRHWKIYLHENQCYLGRTVVWAKRDNALDFFDMGKDELDEYFEIGKELKRVTTDLFKPDLYNYATLANDARHLHTHFIPRYASARQFYGVEFRDDRWGHNYSPYDKNFKLTEERMLKIKDAIAERLK